MGYEFVEDDVDSKGTQEIWHSGGKLCVEGAAAVTMMWSLSADRVDKSFVTD